jgi:hypothetical protein
MKPSGVEYDHKFLLSAIESGIQSNRDGIGGAVRKSSSKILRMNKGHFNHSVTDFYRWLKDQDIQTEDEVMVHLRMGTEGARTIYNQHPYILGEKSTSSMVGALSQLTLDDDDVQTGVFAHNGIFSWNEYEKFDPKLSDTYNWGLTFFRTEEQIKVLKNAPLALLVTNLTLKKSFDGQKVCFMFPDREMFTRGNFINDKGYLFSNSGYKRYTEDFGGSSTRGSEDSTAIVYPTNTRFRDTFEDFENEEYNKPSFCGINRGFNLLDHQNEFPCGDSTDEKDYLAWLERADVKNSKSNIVDVEEIVEDVTVTPVEEIEIISKSQVTSVRKLVNSSFGYELKLPKVEPKVIPLLPSGRSEYFNKKYKDRDKKFKLGPLDKILKPVPKNNDVDFISKYAIAADFSLPINLTTDNCKHFTLTNINDEKRGNIIFTPDTQFTIGMVTLDNVYLRGVVLGEMGINDEDYSEYLIRTHDQIGNHFKIRPKHSMINVYRDYMRLVETFGTEISLNKSRTLKKLVFTAESAMKASKAKTGITADKNYTFIKQLYNGIALVEFYYNFVKYNLDAKDAQKQAAKESLFNEPYTLVDNHKSLMMN